MYQFPIGVLLESFKTDIETAVKKAKEAGVAGVQLYAVAGEMAPENMTKQKIKTLKELINGYDLKVSALCGDLGKGFMHRDTNPELIEKSKRILDLSKELGTNIVTTHIGVVPEDTANPRYQIMQEACFELANYAESIDGFFAIETGPERALTLRHFLDGLHSKGVSVNLDPANFVMVTGQDPAAAVYELKDYIVHTHAKDGIKLLERDPELTYGVRPIEDVINEGQAFEEVPLGEGSVNWPEYLTALTDIGYKGFLTIEREVGENPEKDIKNAVSYLSDIMAKNK